MGVSLTDPTGARSAQVDDAPDALRIIEYDAEGNARWSNPNGAYFLDTYARLGILTAGAAVALFAMRNGATRQMRMKRIRLQGGFAGTAAATETVFSVVRFATATPTGGAAVTPAKKDTTAGASTVADARDVRGTNDATSGLTTTGVAFETIGEVTLIVPHQNGSVVVDESFGAGNDKSDMDLVIGVNEGLALIVPAGNTIAGVFVSGMFEWEEYAI